MPKLVYICISYFNRASPGSFFSSLCILSPDAVDGGLVFALVHAYLRFIFF